MLTLSFPRFGHPGVAWMALVPLLVALAGGGRRGVATAPHGALRPFLLGLTSGVAYFAGTLYWITTVMQTHGGVPLPVGILINALLVAYLALFPAAFAVIIDRLIRRLGRGALLLAPVVWVATELGRSHLLSGFPWVLVGYSQATVTGIAQLASLGGVLGLSALVVLVNSGVAYAVMARGWRRVVPAAVAVVLVGATAIWGGRRVADGRLAREGTPVLVGLVQGNIPQDEKWDASRAESIFRTYLDGTREASDRGAQLIVWPEASTPYAYEEDRVGREAIRQMAARAGAHLLVGSGQVERGDPPRFYNAAYMVGPDGRETVYRKMHLVPFGEYVPLKGLLFFVGRLVESVGDFSPGLTAVLLPVGSHRVGTSICYEVVYPALVRRFVLAGSDLLATITNDAWYGWSSAPYQHFEQASLRAVEQGRYLVRAANTGISGIVDPYGRVVVRSGLFERAVLVGEARYLTDRTVYATIGDLLAHMCALLTALALAATWLPVAGRS